MIQLGRIKITSGQSRDILWTVAIEGTSIRLDVAPPTLELDGETVKTDVSEPLRLVSSNKLRSGLVEHRLSAPVEGQSELTISLILRVGADTPFVRFCYELQSGCARTMTKRAGSDNLEYLRVGFSGFADLTEIRFSEFNELFHSFMLAECPILQPYLDGGIPFMGPMLAATGEFGSAMLAYEHGSQYPDRFLEFVPASDAGICLRAVKGNYHDGRVIDASHPFRSIWFQIGGVGGGPDELRDAYRTFQLTGATANAASRKPYIFYNTWNFQERNQSWNKHTYLQSMTQERMLAEIDVAHRMGVDVFVLDTGWYEKTGDWCVSRERFPNALKDVREKLDSYGMKLGLWFNPTAASVSSRMALTHDDCIRSWNEERREPSPVWETETSWDMCLVSRYSEAFADELIRLYHELGVTYFKWDAIGQYGCSDPRHRHGESQNSNTERSDCYAFELGGAMAAVVDKLCQACPDAIVDFDITEGTRSVGLSFLSVGKYFLINNGPYYDNFDVPAPPGRNVNLFFYPGPARAWICRAPLTFDRWFPSVLFLTHYLPDDPAENQWICLASLMLGQNGIWGDLLSISEEGIQRFGGALERYKQVRDDITWAIPIQTGHVGGAPEVYEKIAENGCGLVSLFSTSPGQYTYITQHRADRHVWQNSEHGTVSFDAEGRAVITMTLNKATAGIVLFGVKP